MSRSADRTLGGATTPSCSRTAAACAALARCVDPLRLHEPGLDQLDQRGHVVVRLCRGPPTRLVDRRPCMIMCSGGELADGGEWEQLGGQLLVTLVIRHQFVQQRNRLSNRTIEVVAQEQAFDAPDIHLQPECGRADLERQEAGGCRASQARFGRDRSGLRPSPGWRSRTPRRWDSWPIPKNALRTRRAPALRRSAPAGRTPRRDCSLPSLHRPGHLPVDGDRDCVRSSRPRPSSVRSSTTAPRDCSTRSPRRRGRRSPSTSPEPSARTRGPRVARVRCTPLRGCCRREPRRPDRWQLRPPLPPAPRIGHFRGSVPAGSMCPPGTAPSRPPRDCGPARPEGR